ncbi:MAG: ATP synthase F0 subunit B [Acidobacteria bacterium]|nr:ATP synthase F0 subunit B [Acidobacteriota bacterium]MCZ6751642.1 ATP synthase F0 subunit B [Acidobacteriota bacterium]
MDVLASLKDILLQAIPTFTLVWILYFYTSRIFFRPLQKTLQERHASTAGLRQAAEANIALAEQKTSQYQEALQSARTELYRQQEQERQQALDRRAEILRQSRQQAEEMVKRAQQEIRAEAEQAKKRLETESDQIALSIAQAILKSGPAASPAGPGGGLELPR